MAGTTSDRAGWRRLLIGAAVGVPAGAAGVAIAAVTGAGDLLPSLPVVVIAWVALRLGWRPAAWTYLTAGTTAVALIALSGRSELAAADLIRLVAYALFSPIVIVLGRGVENSVRQAEAARDVAVAAQRELTAQRTELERIHSELSAAWQQADRTRARLEEVAEAIPEPLVVFDAEARGTYANRAALRTFGRSFSERSADEWARLSEPRDERGTALPQSEWPQLRGAKEPFRRRMLVRLPMSGRDLLIDVEGTPVPDGGCVLLLRDVGKEVDERRRLSRFASFVAHELRNPLAVAKARIELAQRNGTRARTRTDHGARALESVDAAIGILERLELFSRAEAGRLEAARDPFDVRAALRSGVERLRVRGSERRVDVSMIGPTIAIGDQQLAEQAITNLLINADRYSDADEPIRVSLHGGELLELRVHDGGPGIPDELAEVLFRERVSSGRGLGIGLYLVHAAMQAQGGSVLLEQRRPAAVFLLRWPAAPAELALDAGSEA
jgi:nitrogen-specific signal transduction histidine kinase